MKINYSLQLGKISKQISLEEYVIRCKEEIDYDIDDENDDEIEEKIIESWIAQGIINNENNYSVDEVKISILYYDEKNKFIGLDKSTILDEDEIDANGQITFSIDLEIPDNTEKCLLNISAKKMHTGLIMKLLCWGKG